MQYFGLVLMYGYIHYLNVNNCVVQHPILHGYESNVTDKTKIIKDS